MEEKETILVDTLGLPWSIKVTTANISDNQARILAIDSMSGKVLRLKKITTDTGYKLAFKEHIEANYQWKVEVIQKPKSTKGFIRQKWRWRIERSFGWLRQPRSILDQDCSEMWKK